MRRILFFVLTLLVVLPHDIQAAAPLGNSLSGRILLQVESKGEAWYVDPVSHKRYSLGRPADAFALMRKIGTGISNNDLKKIPIAVITSSGIDTDKDGLSDDFEVSLGTSISKRDTDGDGYDDKTEVLGGYNPLGDGKISLDTNFTLRQSGKIFLQTQGKGEAWYIDPVSHKRYFLGRPADAFAVMRSLGLGISNANLNSIEIASTSSGSSSTTTTTSSDTYKNPLNLTTIEQNLHKMVNEQRAKNNLPALKWNNDLAAVAREHSANQATENIALTDLNKICNYAIIHHEGLVFGIMPAERLNSRGINYFSRVGENIALIGVADVNYLVNTITFSEEKISACQAELVEWNDVLENDMKTLSTDEEKIARLNQELAKRRQAMSSSESFKISGVTWHNNDLASQEAIDGWMNSPGHRANILNSDYDEAGIGVTYVNGYIIATQVFIKRAACGYTGGPCCERSACYLPSTCSSEKICR